MSPLVSPEPRWLGGYRLLRRLGSGGAGTVWEAEDEGGGRVALKMLHPALAETEEGRSRLLREARLVNQIPGGGVARVLDVESEDTVPFVVTELVDGPTLAQVVAEAPLSAAECLSLAVQLEEILHRLHQAGIVHRDLKPSNIIIGNDGPVLIDFGIAQALGDERFTQTGKVTGTPGYVSPELLRDDRGATFEQWCAGDWWAWSALLLSSMTGAPPFGVGSLEVVVPRVFAGHPELSTLAEPLRSAFAGALAQNPDARVLPWDVIEAIKRAAREPRPGAAPAPVDIEATAISMSPPGTEPTMIGVPASALPPAIPFAPWPEPAPGENPAVANYLDGGLAQPPWAMPAPSAFFPPQEYPYVSPPLPRLPVGIAVTTLALSLLAAWAAGPGLIVAAAALVGLATVGAARDWREARRTSNGGARSNDTLLASLGAPWHLLRAVVRMIPGIAAGGLVLIGGWLVVGATVPSAGSWREGLLSWIRGDAAAGPEFPVAWIIAALALLTAVTVGTSAPARRGIRLGLQRSLPTPAARAVAYSVVLAGIALAAFLLP